MRKSRFLLVAALVSVLAAACSSPTMPPYPTPDDTKEKPQPPNPGLVRTNG